MCGIAGAIGFVDSRVVDAVASMNSNQSHRGPDGQGSWVDPGSESDHRVALAHRRLAIIDLNDVAAQPMVDSVSGCVIVYNGEVYNYPQIRDQLLQEGVTFQSESDTEVVLKAYVRWGVESLARFRGMFAFAIWNPRTRQVSLVRDRMGIKPLYVCEVETQREGRTLLFASEVRALLASGLISRTLDPVGLSTYVWNGFVAGPGTIVRGIRSVSPGSVEIFDLDDLTAKTETFWRLPAYDHREDALERLEEELPEAVRMRLVSDVPLGVFLSGGVDSSLVAALACRAAGEVKTFNIAFSESEYDESKYAVAVARAIGAEHQEIRLSQADFKAQLGDALRSIDQPTFDAINTYYVSRAVRDAGLTVALAGTGGDELFGGYSSFVDLPRVAAWTPLFHRLPKSLLRLCAHAVARWKMGRFGIVPPQTRWGKLADVLATGGKLVDAYQVSYALFREDFLDSLLQQEHRNGTLCGLSVSRYETLCDAIRGNSIHHSISMLELSCFLGDRLLRDTDAASMAVSLEVRVPLVDHEVIGAASCLDQESRFFPIRTKSVLRRLAARDVDGSLFDRPKAGFVLPIEKWCREEIQPTVAATLLDEDLCRTVGLNPEVVRNLWQAFNERAPGIYWSRIWSIFVLLWWAREHRMSI